MNIYDFDETIYKNDSTRDFYFYCLKRYPKMLLTVPMTGFSFLMFRMGIWSKTRFKEKMYRFLLYVKDIEKEVEAFWDLHENDMKEYYSKTRQDSDIVISASPEFLLKPIAKRLSFGKLIASKVDMYTGKYDGENCWGEEKVKRLKAETGITECDTFYSDSLSDTPLARIAKRAYIVKGEELIEWSEFEKRT